MINRRKFLQGIALSPTMKFSDLKDQFDYSVILHTPDLVIPLQFLDCRIKTNLELLNHYEGHGWCSYSLYNKQFDFKFTISIKDNLLRIRGINFIPVEKRLNKDKYDEIIILIDDKNYK